MSSSLDKEAIRRRALRLETLEAAAHEFLGTFAPGSAWPLGDAIQATLEDVRSLLDAANDDLAVDVYKAIVGIQRAHGVMISPPAGDMPFDAEMTVHAPTDRPPVSDDYTCDSGPPSSDAFPPDLMFYGQTVKIEGGPNDGRFAVVKGQRREDMTYSVGLLDVSVEPVNPLPVPWDRLFVVISAPETKPDEQERKREETACLVSEWTPTKQQIAGYAKDLGVSEARVGELLGTFRIAFDAGPGGPKKARWGGAFKDWAAKQASTYA